MKRGCYLARMVRAGIGAVLAAFALQAGAQALEVKTATELRLNPALDARVLQRLPAGTRLEQTGSQGGWVKARAGNREGWVRLTHVQSLAPPAAAAAGGNPLTGLAGAFSANSTRPTQTTAVRGLDREGIENATPNPAEVQLLERYATTAAQATQHARSGQLNAQRID